MVDVWVIRARMRGDRLFFTSVYSYCARARINCDSFFSGALRGDDFICEYRGNGVVALCRGFGV